MDALKNPYGPKETFKEDFLNLAPLKNVITDTHFGSRDKVKDDRDRMGRLVSFVARMAVDKKIETAKGLGVNANTAVLVESDGTAQVVGTGYVYFLTEPTTPPATDAQGKLIAPLDFANVRVRRVDWGSKPFKFVAAWEPGGLTGLQYTVTAKDGMLSSSTGDGSVY